MILELKGIFKNYQQGKMSVPVLKDVNFSMEEGEYVAIMGPSGSGKTTLMNIIGCLDKPTEGKFFLDRQDILNCSENDMSDIRLNKIGFVFQSFHLLPRQSALANVELPLNYAKVPKKERRERAMKALERVGLADRVDFQPNQLSGGQMQRVAIARAIVNNPKLLLADEPTGALDSKSGAQVMELFQKLNDEGVTVLMITHDPDIAAHAKRVVMISDGELKEKEVKEFMKKKIIIGILIAALVAGGSAGGAVYYKKSHQKTVSVVSVDSLAGQYYMDDTNLNGNIVTSATQSVNIDKDMIIKEVYVSKGDSVKKGDQLMSFDMTLVQMELNIAKLKQKQQEQDLNKAINRLSSLKNGGKIEESDGETLDTSGSTSDDTDTSSAMDDSNETASTGGSVKGNYLAAIIQPVLAAAVEKTDIESANTEETAVEDSESAAAQTQGTESGSENSSDGNADSSDNSSTDVKVEFEEPDTTGNDTTVTISPEPTNIPDDNADGDFTDEIEIVDTEPDTGTDDLTDGSPMFYQVLDENTEPYTGTGTEEDPYVFLCSSAKGYVVAKGSFLNKMAAFQADGTKEPGREGYWYQLEFHQNDTITNLLDRKESCTGYYLVDGGLLEKMVTDNSEVEFSLDGASHYEKPPADGGGDGGGGGDDGGSASVSRDEAIKIQQTKIDSLKLDIRESKLNIEKLEKKVKKEVIYSKLDGTVAKVGDPVTGASDGNSFMTIKSKEGYYVKGTVSELMLDQVKEGTILNCSSQNGDFEAEVIDVSEYPVSGDNYSGNGNPNVSYYTYIATIPDKTVKVSDEDWLTISLTNNTQSKGIVLDRAFVRSENGASYVYKDDNGVLKKQVLTVGGNVNGGYSVLITGGITRDDKIAFPYGDTVKEGAKTKEVSSSEIYGY